MTKSNTNNTLINENLPKYCGHFTNKHLSTINLILKIGMILKKLKIINWFSQWTKKKYYLTIIINFIIFKIKILTIQKLSYTNKYTKRTFGKTDDIFILIKINVNFS